MIHLGKDKVSLQVTKPRQEVSAMSLLELFVAVDDYCIANRQDWQGLAIEGGPSAATEPGDCV